MYSVRSTGYVINTSYNWGCFCCTCPSTRQTAPVLKIYFGSIHMLWASIIKVGTGRTDVGTIYQG